MNINSLFKNKERVILIILFFNPFLDIIYTINNIYLGISFPINQMVRIIILFYFFIQLRKKSSLKIIMVVFLLLFLSEISSIIISRNINFFIEDISYMIKILYFIITLLYISEMISKKEIKIEYLLKGIALGTLVLCLNILLAKYLNIGLKSYDDGVRDGVKGFFTVVNTLTAMMVINVPLILSYYNINKSKKYLALYLISCYSLMLIGTKFALASSIILLLFLILYLFVKIYNTRYRNIFIFCVVLISIILVYLSSSRIIEFINSQLEIYSKYSYNNILDFITSNRTLQIFYLDQFIEKISFFINPIYMFGLGFTLSNSIVNIGKSDFQMVEMDLHGVLYYSGIFLFSIIIILITISILRVCKLIWKAKNKMFFMLILISIILGTLHAIFAGHVIYEAGPLLYYATALGISNGLFLNEKFEIVFNKRDKIEKNKIIEVFDKFLNLLFYYEDKFINLGEKNE